MPNVANDPQSGKRRWRVAKNAGDNPANVDAVIDHPDPRGQWIEVENVPLLLAPDPGGVAPRAGSFELLVEHPSTPVQHSPITNWNPGTPYPGPPARVTNYIDLDSVRWWGSTGQGRLIWSGETEFSGDLPPAIPQDMSQHIAAFSRYMGGYPTMARNRPSAFSDQTSTLNPVYPTFNLDTQLPPG